MSVEESSVRKMYGVLIICPECGGIGHFNHRVDVGTHKSEYEYHSTTCEECKGSGRLIRTERLVPYVQEKPKYELE